MLEVSIKKKLEHFTLESSFTLDAQCLGILGASGCGKSVTLKCIAGILTPEEGFIRLNGRTLFDSEKGINLRPQQRKVGYLFQNYALFPNMTVYKNIAAGFHGEKKELAQRTEELLQLFSLPKLRDSYPKTLSGGEQQRTALARLLIAEPEALLLDEPFSALDAYLKEALQIELKELIKKLHVPSVLVTHNRDEVYRLSEKLLIMEQGHVEQLSGTKELFAKPKTFAAARLTGCKNLAFAAETQKGLYVPEWELLFEMPKTDKKSGVPHAVGIRAHDFISRLPEGRKTEYIPISVCIKGILESPFEWNVMFQKQGVSETNHKLLWWKVSKELINERANLEQITTLYIRKTGIILIFEQEP